MQPELTVFYPPSSRFLVKNHPHKDFFLYEEVHTGQPAVFINYFVFIFKYSKFSEIQLICRFEIPQLGHKLNHLGHITSFSNYSDYKT